MDNIEAIHGRRSIRVYRPDPLKRALIEDVIWDAAQAPTPPASGETPWAFIVIECIERIAEYGARATRYARDHQPEGRHWAWTEDPDFKVFWDAPALVIISGKIGNVEAAWDCSRAGQNLMPAAHARGLGSCWVGAPVSWLTSPGVGDLLGLPAGFEPIAPIILGYSSETTAGNPRPRPRPVIIRCGM